MSSYDQQSLDRLEPSYLASYGLREAPFSESHDDRFFYLEPERAQCMNMLLHMVQYSDLLLMVTGERGTGKSALMQHLLHSLAEQWQVCQVYANTMMDAEQLLFQIARGFAVENLPQTSAQLQEQLYQRLASLHERDKIPLLIVDDAHELPQDALEMLLQLADVETAGGKLVRIILFCEPQIETMLNSPSISSLRDRITHKMEMPALSEAETAEYIKHRLAVSGFDGTSPFTPKMIKKIHKASHGLPAQINVLAHESLEQGDIVVEEDFVDEIREPSERRVTPLRMLIGATVIIFVALVLVYQDDINRVFEGQVDRDLLEANLPRTDAEVMVEAEPAPEPEVGDSTPMLETPAIKEKVIALKPDSMALDTMTAPPVIGDDKDQAVFAGDTEQTTPGVSATTTRPDTAAPDLLATPASTAEVLEVTGIEPQPIIGSRKRQTVSIIGSGFGKASQVRLQWSGRNKVLDRSQVILEDQGRLNLLINTGTKADTWKVTVINGKQKSNTYTFAVLPPPRDTHSVVDGQKWINQQTPDHFTLQLLSVYQLDAVEKYIKQHNLDGDDIAIIKTLAKGQVRYVLVKGNYDSRGMAEAGVLTLPAEVQKAKPWIRPFQDLQSQIKSTKASTAKATVAAPRSAISLLKSDKIPDDSAQQTAWLWSQDPRHFTLQLFGTYQRDSAMRFISQHQLRGKVATFKTQRSGRDWYVLVYGSYPDRARAKQAISSLSSSLSRTTPWVRSFASIHEVLHGAAQ